MGRSFINFNRKGFTSVTFFFFQYSLIVCYCCMHRSIIDGLIRCFCIRFYYFLRYYQNYINALISCPKIWYACQCLIERKIATCQIYLSIKSRIFRSKTVWCLNDLSMTIVQYLLIPVSSKFLELIFFLLFFVVAIRLTCQSEQTWFFNRYYCVGYIQFWGFWIVWRWI